MYVPTEDEQRRFTTLNGKHVMLCTGHGVTEDGVKYLECQDKRGPNFADEGYVRIALGCGLLRDFVLMVV